MEGKQEQRHVHEEGHDQEHHEKKSVLKKVKEKAKKIKETITKKHEHGEEHHHEEEEEEEEDEEPGHSEEEEKEEDAEIHGAPMYESEAARGFAESQEKASPAKDVKFRGTAASLEKDPAAPTEPSSEGKPELGLIRAFQAMSTEERKTPPETEIASKEENELGYKEKITSTLVDKAVHAKEAAAMAAAGTAEYGKKIAETVYEKITPQKKEEEKGGIVAEGDRTKPTDKWVSMKEYLSEKLSPGEEDEALCEVISERIQKRKGEEGEVREGRKVEGEKAQGGVMGKIKGAVVSVFGAQHSSHVKAREEEVHPPRLQESAN